MACIEIGRDIEGDMKVIKIFALIVISLSFQFQFLGCGSNKSRAADDQLMKTTAESVENTNTTLEAISQKSETSSVGSNDQNLLGCWSGMKGGSLQFADGKVQHRLPDKTLEFNYKILAELDHRYPETIILETDSDHFGFLDRIIKIRFADKDTINVFTFRNFAAMERDSFTGAGEFIRYECE